MICYYKALKLGFINSSSTIALKASGLMAYMYQKRSMTNLVEYYKKQDFRKCFNNIMIGKVEPIISNCTFEKVSKELLAILPVRMCKNICNKENKNI